MGGYRALKASKPRVSVIIDGNEQYLDSDGNRVNVGNFDSKGLNVNNWNDDNRNDNIGVSVGRQSQLYLYETPTDKSGSFY